MASPITTWEGAEAYFTFADSPGAMGFILVLSIAVTVLAIVVSAIHEKNSYIDYKE